MSNPQGINPQFPPTQLTLDGTTWTRENTYSTTSAVYKCPDHPAFHITLILGTTINTTLCTQVHATPNQLTFTNLHIWFNGGNNFHEGAQHFKDLTKTQQNNAYTWYLDHNTVIPALLNSAYKRLIAAKTAAFPPAPAQAAIVLQAPQHQAAAWELAQQNAVKSHHQYASEDAELQRKLRRVQKSLNYFSLTFPDATLQDGETIHFICDYLKWSAPLDSAVVIWSPIKERPQEVPESKFKALLTNNKTAKFFFVYGTLSAKGRIAWAIPRNVCTQIQMGDIGANTDMQEIIREKAKLDHVVTHVIVPKGYANGHVFLQFIGGLIPHSGWYSYNPKNARSTAWSVAIEFKQTANKLPQCVIQILQDGSSFCAFELLRFAHATDLTKEQTQVFSSETVPKDALDAWAATLPVGAHAGGVVTIDGLQFQVGEHQIMADAATAYKKFKMPAYFLRQTGKKAYFDLAGLEPLIQQGAVQQGGKKIQKARYDEGSQLLIWSDKSAFPLPLMVLSTLPKIEKPELVPVEQCVAVTAQNDNGGVFYVLDLYEATPTCTVLCMLGDSYVLETSTGIRLATHILQLCNSHENIMVMGDSGFMGWIDITLTHPLKDYLKASGLLTTGCVKITEVQSSGAKWWKVRVLEAEHWVCTVNLQQVASTADDELQILSWVLEAGSGGIVLITDQAGGTWLARASSITLEAPPVDTSSNS